MNFKSNNRRPQKRDEFLDEFEEDYSDEPVKDNSRYDDDEEAGNDFSENIDDNLDFDNYDVNNAPMDKYPNLLKGMTEFDEYIRTLYNDWVGLTWNEEQKKFTRDESLQPIMNTKGANWAISFIKTFVKKSNLIAYLEKNEYDYILDNLNTVLYLSLIKRYYIFGFKVHADLLRVWNEIETASLMAISVAGGGKMHSFLAGKGGGVMSYKAGDMNMGGMDMMRQPKKKGFLGMLGFGGK